MCSVRQPTTVYLDLLCLKYYNYSIFLYNKVCLLSRFWIAHICEPQGMANQDNYGSYRIDYLIPHCCLMSLYLAFPFLHCDSSNIKVFLELNPCTDHSSLISPPKKRELGDLSLTDLSVLLTDPTRFR